MSASHAKNQWTDDDPEIRHSLRVIQVQRRGKQIGVMLALAAALAVAFAYAYLSYSGASNTGEPATTTQ